MRRRQFITGLAGVAAWPLAARAQQAAMPLIGFVNAASADAFAGSVAAFRKGLGETGYVEGQNVTVEYHWLEGQYDRLPALMADLVRRRVAVIATPGSRPAAIAAKAATTTIPIVFAVGDDPVKLGLVASLARPGGNATGVNSFVTELVAKLPSAAAFGVLADPAFPPTQSTMSYLQAAARTLGLRLVIANARTDSDLESAFATFSQQHVGAVLISDSAFFGPRREQLAALAARRVLPTTFSYREFALAGGLMSYGSSVGYMLYQAGIYTGRILKGEKPANLPVQQATKLELILNLKTAKALGLTIPETLVATADEVIQ